MLMTSAGPTFRLGSVALPVYLPGLLFSIGEGAVIPVIPVDAARLGGSLALAGFISALIMVGTLIGDIPSGWIVARVGERTAMIGSAVAALIGLVLCFLAVNPAMLGIGVLLLGIATASFALARQAFMTTFVPLSHRARALSLLGGMFRAGYFVGPFLAALVIGLTGSTRSVFAIDLIACVVVAIVLLVLPDPSAVLAARREAHLTDTGAIRVAEGEVRREGLFRTIARHRQVLARMGLTAALIGGLRSSRQVILPLAGVSLGMQESSIALVVGIAGAVDLALFFTSGQIMDRFGRLWSALPSMIGLGIGHLALAVVVGLSVAAASATSVAWFVAVAIFMSLANGVGSGILMTFGADLAPRHDPAPFLGAYRFTGDAGNAAAPLALSGLTALVSLSFAAGALGVVGLLGASLLARWVPRFIPRPVRA
ncbi:putative MFS family arabinose efflux permease [Amnibacterium kyonggiense]|uniref:Putative MFS family arabinose efflux permease n=2 Tax=Amnibacterium kyonggiense TaxID=595671 RepID=A0A4R7FJ92_9MICO|nr:putative MFS family arabinose efflux permease [Amnibacterium kyonggiense]